MRFEIDVKKTGGVISPLWFGHNLEHTRSAVWRGLSAQLIRNRKFAGKPERTGQAIEWYRVGPAETWFLLDSEDTYTAHYDPADHRRRWNEVLCQRMESFRAGTPSGIGQHGIPLFGGREYEARLVLRSEVELPVCVRFAGHDPRKTHFETTLDVKPGDWREFSFTFPAPVTDEHARLEITFDRAARLAIGAVSLLPADHFHGMRRDVVELLKDISVPILRWPGGNFAGDYRWQDGLLEVDKRGALSGYMQIETLPHTRGYDCHEIGTDEFIALCRELGAEPFISINLGRESAELAAGWVEYCNGAADTTWGKVRAEHGHPEPYNVKYWSLGNELGYGHMEGPNAPGEYAEKAAACARAMKDVDPDISLVSSGIWRGEAWYTDCLEPLAEHVDHIAYHYYTRRLKEHAGEEGRRNFRDVVTGPAKVARDLREVRSKIDAHAGKGKSVGISFDEWNVWYAWYRIPGVVDGIHTASMLNMFCREAADLGMTIGCFFEPVNEGAIIVAAQGARLTPSGKVFALFKAHQNNTLVQLDAKDAEADVDAAASLDETSGELVVTLVNRSPDESRQAVLTFANVDGLSVTEGVLLWAENFLPASTFVEEALDVTVKDDDTFTVSLSKHSVARMRIAWGPGSCPAL